METGEPDPVRWARWPLAGPAGLEAWGQELGKQGLLVGNAQAVKVLPCLFFPGVGAPRRSVAGDWKAQVRRDQRRLASVLDLTIRSAMDGTKVAMN